MTIPFPLPRWLVIRLTNITLATGLPRLIAAIYDWRRARRLRRINGGGR